jgi:hypothetical protein
MNVKAITIQEVKNAIKYLKVNKPTGSDEIPAKFYKLLKYYKEEL